MVNYLFKYIIEYVLGTFRMMLIILNIMYNLKII